MTHSKHQTITSDTLSIKSIMPWVVWGLACLFYFYE